MIDFIVNILFSFSFSILGVEISMGNITESVRNVLMISPQSFSTDLWAVMLNINSVIMPICKSLLWLFFLMELIKRATEVDRLSWDYIAMTCIKYFITGVVLTSSLFILQTILNFSGDIMNTINTTISSSNIDTQSLAEALKELNSSNIITNAFNVVIIIIFWFAYVGIEVGILTVAFSKTIKLLIFTAIAPLPLSTLANSDISSGGKRFLMNYISTSLESIGILISCIIYNVMINSITTSTNGIPTFLAFTVTNAIFLFIINIISPLFKEFAGA